MNLRTLSYLLILASGLLALISTVAGPGYLAVALAVLAGGMLILAVWAPSSSPPTPVVEGSQRLTAVSASVALVTAHLGIRQATQALVAISVPAMVVCLIGILAHRKQYDLDHPLALLMTVGTFWCLAVLAME